MIKYIVAFYILLGNQIMAQPAQIEITSGIIGVNQEELLCLAQNIYFEARNQDLKTMEAVGHVTMNRVASPKFPDTVCKVIRQGPMSGGEPKLNRCQFSWYCDGKSDKMPVNDTEPEQRAYFNAMLVAEMILIDGVPDTTFGSTYYHAAYVNPSWSKKFNLVVIIGPHKFYRPT